jgi:aminodeoxyfutalosine deaminase
MRKIAAPYIFPVGSSPVKNGILITEDDGTIIEIIDNKGVLHEIADLEYYNGVIVPGFINCHCHLELSYLNGKINNVNGLTEFIANFIKLRDDKPNNLIEIIEYADKQMQAEGIVAVGDISNGNSSFSVKAKSKMFYYTFAEVFNIVPSFAEVEIKKGKILINELEKYNLPGSIVPHAPYTMSRELLALIKKEHDFKKNIYSIHNQESAYENEMYLTKSGKLYDFLGGGFNMDYFNATGINSLPSMIPFFPKKNKTLLVHNVYTESSDIKHLEKISGNITWVLCPKSNVRIEQKLPDLNCLMQSGISIALGTDSLASNDTLSILKELMLIKEYYKLIDFNTLLKWGTLNGAISLGIETKYGSFDKGKKPGINLITAFDFEKMSPTSGSMINILL